MSRIYGSSAAATSNKCASGAQLCGVLVFLLTTGGRFSAAQQNEQPALSGKTSSAVALHLIAQTRAGLPVSDLESSEIELSIDGKRQSISELKRMAPVKGVPVVILIDLLNLEDGSSEKLRSELVRLLETVVDPQGIYVYLISKEGSLYPVHALSAAATAETKLLAGSWQTHYAERISDALKQANALKPFTMRDNGFRIRNTFHALHEIGDLLAASPGRKSIVWISHGVREDQFAFEVCTELDRNNIAVYTVQQMTEPSLAPITGDLLNDVAKWTGGVSYQSGYMREAVLQARSDAGAAYLLESAAAQNNMDSKFHKVRVVSRRSDVRVRSETGYWALRPSEP